MESHFTIHHDTQDIESDDNEVELNGKVLHIGYAKDCFYIAEEHAKNLGMTEFCIYYSVTQKYSLYTMQKDGGFTFSKHLTYDEFVVL